MKRQEIHQKIEELAGQYQEAINSDLSDRAEKLYEWLYENSVHKQTVSDLLHFIVLQNEQISLYEELLQNVEQAPYPASENAFFPMSTPSYKRR